MKKLKIKCKKLLIGIGKTIIILYNNNIGNR